MKGRVYRIVGNSTIVRVGAEEYSCQFRGKLKRERKKVLRLVSVGDEVEFEPSGAGEGMIEKVLPRKTKLSRHDSFRPRFEQVIAANVDQLVVVHSATDPELNLLTIDRCTVMGEAAGLVSVLCINKDDLQDVRDSVLPYEKAGYPLVLTSAKTGEGVEALKSLLRGKISVLLGPSGVGKSSILNALSPDLELKTGAVSTKTKEGRHTTTWVELIELEPGMEVIDTPGLEFFTLWGATPENIRELFPEFFSRQTECRYRNCSHTKEGECAVLSAIESGAIPKSRHDSYLTIREDLTEKRRQIR